MDKTISSRPQLFKAATSAKKGKFSLALLAFSAVQYLLVDQEGGGEDAKRRAYRCHRAAETRPLTHPLRQAVPRIRIFPPIGLLARS